ncbi:MAG: glycosyltransferase family 39 protein [Chloracidobacterium sp.]|nr:glycosyltransferase family 39 protein [Chloracidobacterium sp.]MDW8216924.1 glycosyltransferase family 39 protein [Acidobacteriota bacterium]
MLLVLACGVAFFWRLGDLGLLGPDEPRYARVAREMWTQGEWITPTLGKTPWFEKPALLYWLIGLGYHLIGVNEWAVRLPSAVAATLTVLALSALRPAHLGWSAALIATTSPLMLAFARAATFEALLTFAVTISLLMFHLSFEAVQSGWRMTVDFARVLFYVFLGIGLLAKGLVGLVLPVGSILLYALVVPDVRRQPAFFLRTLRPLTGLFITAAVAGIWYIPVMAQHGWAFVEEFFIAHHFQRFTSNRFRHPGPAYYYAPIVLLGVLPWTPFLLAGLYRSLRRLWRPNKLENALSEAPQSLIWLALCAFTFPILFFSFSGSKLPGYVLPAIPFAAILAAYGFWSLSARMRTLWLGVAGLGQVGLYIGLQIFIDKSLMEKTLSFIELFAGGLLVAGLGVSAVYAAQPSDALLRLSGGTLLLVLWLTTSFPALEAKFSTKGLSAAIDRAAQPGEIVAFFGCREYAPVFYNPAYTTCCDATREPYHLPNQAAVAAAVAERRTLLVVVPKARLAMLQSSAYTLTLLGEAGRFTLARLTATGPPSPKA